MGFLGKLTKTIAAGATINAAGKAIRGKPKKDNYQSGGGKVRTDDAFSSHPVSTNDGLMKSSSSSYSSSYGSTSFPRNHGGSWSMDEENRLRDGYNSGASIQELSDRHGRSDEAIRYRLRKFGYTV